MKRKRFSLVQIASIVKQAEMVLGWRSWSAGGDQRADVLSEISFSLTVRLGRRRSGQQFSDLLQKHGRRQRLLQNSIYERQLKVAGHVRTYGDSQIAVHSLGLRSQPGERRNAIQQDHVELESFQQQNSVGGIARNRHRVSSTSQ